jgi:signal transduction histidine kinase
MSSARGIRFAPRSFPPRLPRRTARLRLALLYGCVFIACGAGLLAITYLLVAQNTAYSVRLPGPPGRYRLPAGNFAEVLKHGQHAADLHSLLLMSAIALTLMATVSIVLGWLIAGRVLRPLRTITAATRDISATNLHRRLALGGPDDELTELADTIDALLGRLEVSFDAQRRFVANASHELRTPLARLKTLLQVALADPDATVGSMRHAQQRALASEHQLERLIDALLTLASGERAVERREPLDLAPVTEGLVEARARETDRRGLLTHATLKPAGTLGNQALIERLVANLLDNAIVHNKRGGWIEVATETRAGRAILTVANSGSVIAPADLGRLLQPFQRAESNRTNHGDGYGLGLSIVAAITTAHGGTLDLHAPPEGGLRARVELASRPSDGRSAFTQVNPTAKEVLGLRSP